MFNLNGLDMEINRGNAASLTIHFGGGDAPENGTEVLFQVKPSAQYGFSLIEKTIMVDNNQISIDFLPEDTQNLDPGIYYWNAHIQFHNGLEPWTILREWKKFQVLP